MKTLRRLIKVALALGAGCAPAGDDAAVAPLGAAVSASFAVGTSSAAAIAPVGEGVTLRWAGADVPPLAATTSGLGAVERRAVAADGAVTLGHPDGVEERWEPRADGAAQSWRYAARPADGRVAVGVTLGGATLAGADGEGLRLRASTGALLRYSHATWIGADGARTAVPARWEGDHVAIEVPPEVVARTRFPAVLDPVLTAFFALSEGQSDGRPWFYSPNVVPPEIVQVGTSTLVLHKRPIHGTGNGLLTVRQIDANGAYVPGSFRGIPASAFTYYYLGQRPAWAASYGTGAMVAAVGQQGLIALRLAADGRPLDAAPIVLHPVPYGAQLPEIGGVACTASVCLVAYTLNGAVLARRVGTDGLLLDAAAITLGPSGTFDARHAVVAVGDRFVVGWTTILPGAPVDLRLGRVTTAGVALDPGGRPVTTAGGARNDLELATDGSRLFLKWFATASGPRVMGTYTQLFDADLTALTALAVSADVPSGASAWWDGAQYLVVNYQRLVRFDAAGARLDAAYRTVLSSAGTFWIGPIVGGFYMWETEGFYRYNNVGARVTGPNQFVLAYYDASGPATDFESGQFLVGWARSPGMQLQRLDAAGNRLDVPRVESTFRALKVGLNGARAELFAGDQRATVDLAARTTGPTTTMSTGAEQIVRGGSQRLLLSRGCARRLSAAWQTLDLEPVCFTPATSLAADFDGTNFRFVYALPQFYTRRMNQDGDLVEFAPLALTSLGNANATPQIAFGAGAHLLVWSDGAGPGERVRAARLALDGTPGAAFTVSSDTAEPPAVVFDGVNFVVAWVPRGAARIHAARVSPAGALLDATPFALNVREGAPLPGQSFSMVSDQRGSTLFAYVGVDLDFGGDQVRGAFLREDGVVVPDGGVVPIDVPPAIDAGTAVDTGTAVDAGTAVDTGTAVDVGTAIDAGTAADTGTSADTGTVVDVGTAIDAGTAVDVGTAVDAGAARDAVVVRDALATTDTATATDAPAAADVGADAGSPVVDNGGCSVGGAPSRRAPSWAFALGAALFVGARRRRTHRRPTAR
jgi:MYXO-CTERM domain-containing protein